VNWLAEHRAKLPVNCDTFNSFGLTTLGSYVSEASRPRQFSCRTLSEAR
jgi:hypothetical protein